MKIKFLIGILLVPLFFYGQDIKKMFGRGSINITPYINLGGHYLNTPSLKEKLSTLNYELPKNMLMSVSAGLRFGKKKLKYGVELTGSIPFKKSTYFTQGQIFIAYEILKSERFWVMPEFGTGIQNINTFIQNINQSNNFDSLVLSSGNYFRLNTKSPILNIAVTFCIRQWVNSKKVYLRPISTIKMGYTTSLSKRNWKTDNQVILDSPIESPSSFYIQFVIGRFL